MASIKVKRSLVWDAWQLTAESFNEVLDVITTNAVVVSTTDNSITFKNKNDNPDVAMPEETVEINDWVLIPGGTIFVSKIPENRFSSLFEEVVS